MVVKLETLRLSGLMRLANSVFVVNVGQCACARFFGVCAHAVQFD